MRFKISFSKEPNHSEVVSCVGWASPSDLYSIGDDHLIQKWNMLSDETTPVATLPPEVYCTDIHWYPTASLKKPLTAQSELFVLACTDGRFLLVSKAGRVEKTVEGHKGAVLGTRWGHDGTTLLTFGEDATVKVWSRTGMLRSVLTHTTSPVYAASWSPDSNQVLYAEGSTLVLKPLQPSVKPTQWKAHDALILAVDWSTANNLLISAGEDRKYKVWDNYGRILYTSLLHDSPLVSLSWAPDGELFAVGGFNTLRLCDKAGVSWWSHCLEKPSCGTVLHLCWSTDSTQVGGACGSGQVLLAEVVGRNLEWHSLNAVINGDNSINVKNILNDSNEHLEFNEKVVKVSLDWGYLLVITTNHGYIYREQNWTTPVTFELKDKTVNLVKQAERYFVIVDGQLGVQVFSYEGRLQSNIKQANLTGTAMNPHCLSVTNDTVAITNQKDPNAIHLFDTATGKPHGDGQPLQHKAEIEVLGLSLAGIQQQRQLAFIDKNHDLYIATIRGFLSGSKPVLLAAMVTSLCWNDRCNILAAMQNSKLMMWYHPAVVYADRDLLQLTTVEISKRALSKSPQVVKFIGSHCTLHRSDGAQLMNRVSPFPALLHKHALLHKWAEAVRLCRLAKDFQLWACLAGMATAARELSIAIIAYSAISELDKVQHLKAVQELTGDHRSAELALFTHQPHLAESMYMQAKMVFKAIKLNLDLFNWDRALELAVRHKTHVDTVLAFRNKYLEEVGGQETSKRFKQYADKITIDWDKINAKIAMEEN